MSADDDEIDDLKRVEFKIKRLNPTFFLLVFMKNRELKKKKSIIIDID